MVVEEFEEWADLVEARSPCHRTLLSVSIDEARPFQFREMYVVHRQFQSVVFSIRIELVEGDRPVLAGTAIQQREKQPTTLDVA